MNMTHIITAPRYLTISSEEIRWSGDGSSGKIFVVLGTKIKFLYAEKYLSVLQTSFHVPTGLDS